MKTVNYLLSTNATINFSLSACAVLTVLGLVACTSTLDHVGEPPHLTQGPNELEQAAVSEVRVRPRAEMASKIMQFDASAIALSVQPIDRQNTEKYQHIPENRVMQVKQQPVSTFSIDVDTGSYTNIRRMLRNGQLPPSDAVRIEEFINYFDYQYPQPQALDKPFEISTAVSVSPWNAQRHLLRIGLKGYAEKGDNSNGSNLVFLIDVSGSMDQPDKLGLLKKSLVMLTKQLGQEDTVSIVVYAGASGVVLEPTRGNDTIQITQALNKLRAGGSTNGAAGIELAYQLAHQAYIDGGVNRVILATDGDFNVGRVNHNQLIDLIKEKRDQGIALTTLGFGQGNYNDHLMEQLADAGNGNYAYIDTLNESRKVLVDELSATMQMIAKDVKIQVEFNPQQVAEYRLIGYENRHLEQEDFNNDKVDAGDIGAGHSVTALYELTLHSSQDKFNSALRYEQPLKQDIFQLESELAHVKLRFKEPLQNDSKLLSAVVHSKQIKAFEMQSVDFQFASAVAAFGHLLKHSKFVSHNYDEVIAMANKVKGPDNFGYRAEFVQLVRMAKMLATQQSNKIDYSVQPYEELIVLQEHTINDTSAHSAN